MNVVIHKSYDCINILKKNKPKMAYSRDAFTRDF